MFSKLQQKWKVTATGLALILCTFAVTGTLTAWISRQITSWLGVDKYTWGWWTLKIGVLVFGYQVIILLVGFCFGQFRFFWNYEKKILRRLGFFKDEPVVSGGPTRIAIFASGTGSNAQRLIEYFKSHPGITIQLVVSNKPGAGVLQVAAGHGVEQLVLPKTAFTEGTPCLEALRARRIDFIVLAGFLQKVSPVLIDAFPGKIVNIHPALLPSYGGQGMYGRYVHEAVIAAGEKESGITIHQVDEWYDHGQVIFQARCAVLPDDTPETLAQKVYELEYQHFAPTIERLLLKSR